MSTITGRGLRDNWIEETPSGSINGSNVTFTLSNTPDTNNSVRVFLDGLHQDQGTDYTISSVTLTFTTAPAVAQKLVVEYFKK